MVSVNMHKMNEFALFLNVLRVLDLIVSKIL